MQQNIWRRIKDEIAIWRVGLVPGMAVIGFVIIARLSGLLQTLEWIAFDNFLRLRPAESLDERVVIIGINEADIHKVGAYPIPDREIAALIQKLQTYKPRAIGLDIVRDLPMQPGHSELVAVFKNSKNIFGIEKVLPPQFAPPPDLPPQQIGFSDAIPDADGNLRRNLLGTPTPKGYRFYLALRLAEAYLATEDITLENGIRDRNAMRFGTTELPRFLPNSGGYVETEAGGVQVILNFRTAHAPFRTLSLNDIKTGNFNSNWLRDRIIIIGITSPGADLAKSSAISSVNPIPGQVYGVEIQAHAVSQIVSAVLDRRSLLRTWLDSWEYFWIFAWGFLGISVGRLTHSPLKNLIVVCLSSMALIGFSYILLIWGWWIPVAPALLVLILNGVGLTAFYQYDRSLRTSIAQRQQIIDSIFDTIHNGPLQTLAKLLRRVRDRDLPPNQLLFELEHLNHELRAIYESVQKENLTQKESLCFGDGLELDLQAPMHEILYQVYSNTLERDFPCFKTLKIKIRTFDPIEQQHLSIEQKRGLCRFLEEALCNVGKHAAGVTRLGVTYTQKDGWYSLQITDNGQGSGIATEGRGTQQATNLARQLKGKFKRSPLLPQGTVCELTWPIPK